MPDILKPRRRKSTHIKILIVASEQVRDALLSEIEKDNKYLVGSLEDVKGLFDVFTNRLFDVLILESDLLKSNNKEFYMEIKKNSPSTRIILITSGSGESNVKDAMDAGVYGCIQKPVNEKELGTFLAYISRDSQCLPKV